MIYKAMLENDINDGIIQDPDDPGVDLDAVEKAISNLNKKDSEGMIGDPVEEFAMIMYESEYNYNQIMEAIGMAELREAAMGRDLVLNEADTNGFFAKIKEFFVNMFERLTETVRNVISKLNIQQKSDKKFAIENQDLIEKGFKTDCWKDDSGYNVFDKNLINFLHNISADNVSDIKKAVENLNGFINSNDINKTFEDLKELDKKDLTKVILKSIMNDNTEYKDLGDFRKKQHYRLFGNPVKLKDAIDKSSYVYDVLSNNSEEIEIRNKYKSIKAEYKKIFDNISKWEKNATSNNLKEKDKYLTSCQILTKAYKIERSISNIMFSIVISAYNYKRSVCRKLAHKFVAQVKNNTGKVENDIKSNSHITSNFIKAVEEKDALMIKVMLKDSLVADPTFKEFDEMLSIAEKAIPDIYEEHNGEVFESDTSKWDKDYMDEQMVNLLFNFSKERIALLKNICKMLYSERADEIRRERTKNMKESTSIFDNIIIV